MIDSGRLATLTEALRCERVDVLHFPGSAARGVLQSDVFGHGRVEIGVWRRCQLLVGLRGWRHAGLRAKARVEKRVKRVEVRPTSGVGRCARRAGDVRGSPVIDTVLRLETPEGIDLSISPAGPVARGLALAIDSAIRWGAMLAVGLSLSSLGGAGVGIFLVLLFLAEWFYPVFFEVLYNGQTPGKRALGLRVVNADGTPVSWSASLIRNLLRVADVLPLLYVGGVVSILCTDKLQRLGDLAAGTLVIHLPEARVASGSLRRVAGASHASVPLRPDEQRSILGFAERSGELSDERTLELAQLLEPLTGEARTDGPAELFRIANGLAGRE
jgi:uncharacterized RDD family membrane protein YckC